MNVSTIGAAIDADKIAPPVAEVRMTPGPGQTRPIRVGRTSYNCGEGIIVRVPADHRAALLRAGWADAA
jgi:hypothetical protein